MDISKTDAVAAMEEIRLAADHSILLRRYRHFAPHLIVWGLVWLLANTATDLSPADANLFWLIGPAAGAVASAWLGYRRRQATEASGDGSGWRWMASMVLMVAFFSVTFSILSPRTGEQVNAFISLFWAFLYMLFGIWYGQRIFLVGLLTAAAILVGYFMIPAHFALWMGLTAGGALIAGGFWLRRC